MSWLEIILLLGHLAVLGPLVKDDDSPDHALVSPRRAKTTAVALGVDTHVTTYGTLTEQVVAGAVIFGARLSLGRHWVAGLQVPTSVTGGRGVFCCAYGLGNLSPEIGYGREVLSTRNQVRWQVLANVSLPTAADNNNGEFRSNARHMATAEITRDAGLFLLDTTTARLEAGFDAVVLDHFWLGANSGGWIWIPTDGDNGHDQAQWLIPVRAFTGYRMDARFDTRLALMSVTNLTTEAEPWVHALDLGMNLRRQSWDLGLSVHWPISESLRDLNMWGVGVDYVARL